jgi:hypothetical protein
MILVPDIRADFNSTRTARPYDYLYSQKELE